MTGKTTIRNLDPDLYTQARIAAVEHNCTVADIINDALEEWFGEEDCLMAIQEGPHHSRSVPPHAVPTHPLERR